MKKIKLTKIIQLFIGFFLIALGVVLMRSAGLGLNPWSTFHDGVSKITGLKFGTVTQLTGLTIIIISISLKIYPGVATLLNMYFCGFFINMIYGYNLVTEPTHILLKYVFLIAGIWVLAIGIYVYLSVGYGAGPRDGLMVGLVNKTGKSVSIIRTFTETLALAIGFSLGGQIGIGTIITAVSIGYAIQFVFKHMNYLAKENRHLSILEFFTILFK